MFEFVVALLRLDLDPVGAFEMDDCSRADKLLADHLRLQPVVAVSRGLVAQLHPIVGNHESCVVALGKRFGCVGRDIELAHRRPRPPFTAQNIAVLLPALVQSVALRQLVDQDDLPDGAIRWIVLSAVPLLTAGPSDDLDAQEYTADLLHRTELDRPIG